MRKPEACRAVPGLGPETYAVWRASSVGAITEQLERRLILELAGAVGGRDVLDVGCGDGALALELRRRGAAVSGIDASQAMIAAARERARQADADIAFEVGAADRLPFPAARFDIVTAITILCFVQDAAPVFREIARVLRPGGRLVIGELGRWSSWALQRRIRGWLGSPVWSRALFRTPAGLRRQAAEAGLRPETVRGAIFYPRWAPAARAMAPFDAALGRRTTAGAAFLALRAVKPEREARGGAGTASSGPRNRPAG